MKADSTSRRQAPPSVVRRPDGRIWRAHRRELAWPPRGRGSSVPQLRSKVPAGTYLLTLDFAEVGGRLECVRVEIGTDLDDPNAPDPTPVTTSALRSVPLRELIDQTVFEETKILRRWAREARPHTREAHHLRDRMAAAEASLGRPPGRPPEYTEDHFKHVADAYTRALKVGRPPTQAVGTQWHVSRSTAAKWVARSREMGFLPPTQRGRPRGGQPSAEATKAMPIPRARRSRRLAEIEDIEARQDMALQMLQRHEAWLAELGGEQTRPAGPPTAVRKKIGARKGNKGPRPGK